MFPKLTRIASSTDAAEQNLATVRCMNGVDEVEKRNIDEETMARTRNRPRKLAKNSRDATRAMRYKRAMSLFRFVLRTDR